MIIEKAIEFCQNSKYEISDHFVDVNKMVTEGFGAWREKADDQHEIRVQKRRKCR